MCVREGGYAWVAGRGRENVGGDVTHGGRCVRDSGWVRGGLARRRRWRHAGRLVIRLSAAAVFDSELFNDFDPKRVQQTHSRSPLR
jgi:hypothetical protein